MRIISPVAIAAVTALAAATPPASAATRTIKLTERQTYFHETDNPPSGPSASDMITVRGVLSQHGKVVGHDAVRCTGDRHCHAMLSIGRGTIEASGTQTGSSFTVRIVGGSGRFLHARGSIRVVMTTTGSHYTIKVR